MAEGVEVRHYINRSTTVMLPADFVGDDHWRVIHSRHQLIDANSTLWIKIDSYGESHDIYARLLPVYDGRYPVN